MSTELRLAEDDAYIIKNLWPLYQHEVTRFQVQEPNQHGLLGVDDSVRDIGRAVDALDPWWQDRESLFPYLIVVDGKPAGFNLVAGRSRHPDGTDVDFIVHEFFLLQASRGSGAAELAAKEGFNLHPGSWEIVTWPSNARAIAFWRRTISAHTSGKFSEAQIDHAWGSRRAFRFESGVHEEKVLG